MKVVKVKILPGGINQNQMLYPSGYKGIEVDRSGLHGPVAYSEDIARGGAEAWCLIVLDDALATQYDTDPDMEIITRAQALLLLEEWRVAKGQTEEVVNDPDRMTAIIAKQNASIALSPEDTRALDINDKTAGIVKRSVLREQQLRDVSPGL